MYGQTQGVTTVAAAFVAIIAVFTAIVVVGNLLTLCFYFVRRVDWVFFYLSGEDSKEHKKYSEFDTKHYTREAKFRVFWHKQYSKKYNEFPRVKRVLVKGK